MPRKRVPSYRHNKTTNRAVVTLNGVDYWLGRYGTPESREKYNRLVAEWLSSGRTSTAAPSPSDITIVELIARFWIHAEGFYRKPDGSPTSEIDNFRSALRPLRSLYSSTPAAKFGPKSLAAVRQRMVEAGWCRTNINKQVARIRTLFKWGVAQELVAPSVHAALCAVAGLRKGKSEAAESDPVRPVPDADVDAVRPHVSAQVWAMIQLQRFSGMRPGEVCMMRTCDVDRSGKVWSYVPIEHKTQHHGHDRAIFLGPRAQEVLAPWLRPDLAAFLFQPAEAEAERRRKMHDARLAGGTPLDRGNRPGTNRRRRPEWAPGNRYDVVVYRRAIERACIRAFAMPDELRRLPKSPAGEAATAEAVAAWGVEVKRVRAAAAEWRRLHCWHPHQLRHNAATFLRREYGIDAAKVILGHRTLSATQVYAEQDVAKARQIMGEVG